MYDYKFLDYFGRAASHNYDQPSLRRVQWLQIISREDLMNKDSTHRVCEEHFNANDIIIKTTRKLLKHTALPCLQLAGPCKEDKQTETYIATVDTESQTENSHALENERKMSTMTESWSQTKPITTSDNITLTAASLSANTTRKRSLKSELLGCKKLLKTHETGETMSKSQQDIFQKLCDRLLSKNLAGLVKAQTNLKSSFKGNRSLAYKMFCLKLYYASPQAYSLLAETICLPSKKMLDKLYIPVSTQVNDDFMAALKLKVNNMTEREKHCTLVVDAMSLKTNLFYDIKNDKIIGFHEVDGVQSPFPAEHALVCIIQGIFVKWSQPIGFALLSDISDNNISKWIDKIILKLFEIGLNIRAFVSDMGSDLLNGAINRGISVDKSYFTINDHKIYYIFDAPHLIKLVRNHFMTYDFHFHNGAVAKFEHIVKFYEFDQKKTFKQAYKLTNGHINPNNAEKNKVCYATQLLSRSVATGLSTYIDFKSIDESARHTVEFVKMMNDLFDTLNSSSLRHSDSHKSAFCADEHQIDFFKNMLTFFQTLKLLNPKNGKYCTKTVEFIQGFQVTIQSILNLYEDLKQEGYSYILTRNLNQDIFDVFFGKIRALNGRTEPTSRQFLSAFRKLFFANIARAPAGRKCAEDLSEFLVHLEDFPSNNNDNTEVEHLASIDSIDKENNLHEIIRSDYSHFDIPEENAFFYVCQALFRKCIDRHRDCKVFKLYFDGNLLAVPPNGFVNNVKNMEQVFVDSFEKKYINSKIGMSIYDQLKEIEFWSPCPCFPKTFLQKLYVRMRIYFTLTINKKAFRTCRNRPKYFTVANL